MFRTALLCLWLAALSCSKKNGADADTEFPVISLASPLNGQVFTPGQSIPISGSIRDNSYIAEVHIHVSHIPTGSLLMDVHLYPGSASTEFNQSFTAAAGSGYRIQVLAKDRAVNEARATVEVSCN